MIDRVVAYDPAARTIETEALVPMESPVFEGHFPGHPLLPGVLLIEAMAQTCGWLVIGVQNFARMPFLAAVKQAKLRNFVTPGQRLTLVGRLVHEGSGYAVTQAAVKVDGKATCDAEITFRVVPFPDPAFRANMEKVADAIAFPRETVTQG